MIDRTDPDYRVALYGALFDGMTIMSGGFEPPADRESPIPEIQKAAAWGLPSFRTIWAHLKVGALKGA